MNILFGNILFGNVLIGNILFGNILFENILMVLITINKYLDIVQIEWRRSHVNKL